MANPEDSTCEVPLKRPRLDEEEISIQVVTDVINKSEANDSDLNPTSIPERNGKDIAGTSQEAAVIISESLMSNDGSSSGEPKRAAAFDNSDSDDLSDISDLSGMSEDAWKPIAGPISWVQQQMTLGHNPRDILQDLVTADTVIPPDLDDFTMWKIIINLLSDPPKRKKLQHINTLDDVLELLRTCKKIVVLTGAGVSVSCGIPDFRSRNGIYARLAVDFPDLPDPQAMFDIRYFRNDPRPFFKFAKEIYPGQFEPSRCHKFIRLIEEHGKLLRNYTQNIDTLEQVAGINNIIQCHGSFAGATCMVCRHKVTAEHVKADIFNQIIPRCPVCPPDSLMSILKPDIVFFGESLPDEFHRQMAEDKDECDLLIVIGSSLKVRPVALIPNSLPADIPQVLINREPLSHMNFDVELLGDCDCIISELCKRLGSGWSQLSDHSPPLQQIRRTQLATPDSLSAPVSQTDLSNSNGLNSHDKQAGSVLCSGKESSGDTAPVVSEETGSKLGRDEQDERTEMDTRQTLVSGPPTSTSSKCSSETDLAAQVADKAGDPDNGASETASADVDKELSKISSVGQDVDNGENGLYGDLDTSLQEMRRLWHSHDRQSIAKRLKEDQYLFLPPCRYVFHGAEVLSMEEESDVSDQESSVSESRDLHSSQCGEEESPVTHPASAEGGQDIKLFRESGMTEVVEECPPLT